MTKSRKRNLSNFTYVSFWKPRILSRSSNHKNYSLFKHLYFVIDQVDLNFNFIIAFIYNAYIFSKKD